MKLFLMLLFIIFLKNIQCDIKELSSHEFFNMLTTGKNYKKKNQNLNNILDFKSINDLQENAHIKTTKDFVLYVYAKWDNDSNNLIAVFREVERIIKEKNLKLDFYIFNIENAKDLCNALNITSLPLILYISSGHKKKKNSLFQRIFSSSKDVKINNAFRYNGDLYCYDYIVEWIEIHYHFAKTVLLMKNIFKKKKK
ncbi:conserved protein, unknown function [Hepatocystis sp. ex Piliocolobus tephrosceles]|nr:conserved protein, unknown function [Hepatocystis sp. ex Piliocolobus tephrosceles]